jgi:hypothetical protein
MDRLIVCLPRANVIQRWNLRTLEREAAVPSPLENTITEAAMGWASSGPLLIVGSSRDGFGGGSGMFLDPQTLKPVTYAWEGEQDLVGNMGTNLRVSGDGTVFARPDHHSARSYVLRDGFIRTFHGDSSGFHAIPGTDGSFICTPMGVYTEEMKPIVKPNNPGQLIISPFMPSWQGRFYMRIGDGSTTTARC